MGAGWHKRALRGFRLHFYILIYFVRYSIDAGVGFRYGNQWGDPFWLSARLGLQIGTEDKAPSTIGFDICPSIGLGAFRLYAPVGIGVVIQDGEDALIAWSLNPYIRKLTNQNPSPLRIKMV